jgi:DNA-binding XRE family transcriptional regulator
MCNKEKEVVKISTYNPLKAARERLMISKSELAAKTGLSVMTLDRIEKGKPYRLDTKRKIVEALGFNPWLDNDRSPSHQRQES